MCLCLFIIIDYVYFCSVFLCYVTFSYFTRAAKHASSRLSSRTPLHPVHPSSTSRLGLGASQPGLFRTDIFRTGSSQTKILRVEPPGESPVCRGTSTPLVPLTAPCQRASRTGRSKPLGVPIRRRGRGSQPGLPARLARLPGQAARAGRERPLLPISTRAEAWPIFGSLRPQQFNAPESRPILSLTFCFRLAIQLFSVQREIEPVRRSFRRRRSCTFTEVARLVPSSLFAPAATGLIVFCSHLFTRSNPQVDRCSNPHPWDPLNKFPLNVGIIININIMFIIIAIIVIITITTRQSHPFCRPPQAEGVAWGAARAAARPGSLSASVIIILYYVIV